jgi:hypothetical protein
MEQSVQVKKKLPNIKQRWRPSEDELIEQYMSSEDNKSMIAAREVN